MMFKCVDCGHIFEEGEDRVYTKRGVFYGYCPVCGSEEYEVAERCTNCGGAFLGEELFWGWCLECLEEQVTYNNVYEFFRTGDMDLFHLFMFEKVFDMKKPDEVSEKMTEHLFEVYNRMRNNDLLTDSTEFIDLIRKFILEDDANYGKELYAEFLDERKSERKGVR